MRDNASSDAAAEDDAVGAEPTGDVALPGGPAAAPPGRFSRLTGLGGDYWKLWAASVVSNLGDGISAVALPWLTTELTSNPVLVAGVGVATRLPWLLFSLPAGALVDRGDRRRLMVAMDSFRFVVMAVAATTVALDVVTIPLLYGFALLLGAAEVVFDNAAQTILPSVVPKDRLERANGNLWGAEMVMNQFVGPAVGGLLLAFALAVPFFVDAATFGFAAALILMIRGAFRTAQPASAGRRSLRGEISEGFRWLWGHPLLKMLALLLGLQNMLLNAALVATFVLFAREVLGLDATGWGLLFAAGAVGGIAAAVVGPSVSARIGSGPSLNLVLATSALVFIVMALTTSALVVAAMLALGLFVAVLWNLITVSLRQRIIPDSLLGRVNSVYRFFGWGAIPVGALLGGLLVAAVEPLAGRHTALRAPFALAAVGYAVMFLVARSRLTTAGIDEAKAAAGA